MKYFFFFSVAVMKWNLPRVMLWFLLKTHCTKDSRGSAVPHKHGGEFLKQVHEK